MNFEFTEEQLMVRQAARDFAQNELKPGVIDRDEHQKFPAEQIKKLGELGFMGLMTSEQYGGSGMDAISYVLVMEELSKVDASASVGEVRHRRTKTKIFNPLSQRRKDRRFLLIRTRGRIRRYITANYGY